MPVCYLTAAAGFYLVLYQWKPNSLASKRIQHKPIYSKQYYREMTLSIVTLGIYACAGYLLYALYRNGLTLLYFDVSVYGYTYFVFSMVLMICLHDTYFYWTHRLLHTRFFYHKIHITHHLSSSPTPWTAISFHPAEAVIQATIIPLMVMILPVHPVALMLFLFYSVIINMLGHSGFQLLPYHNRAQKWNWWNNSSTQHNAHHQYGRDNYGLYFTLWDIWMKTSGKEKTKKVQILPEIPESALAPAGVPLNFSYNMKMLTGWRKKYMENRVKWHLFILAWKTYRSFRIAIKVLKELDRFKKSLFGSTSTKIVQVDSKYYYNLYAPGYPSKIFDEHIKGEFNRIVPINKKADLLAFLFFAITKKCPLQCEHCFEWDNLNKKESMELHHLKAIIKKFQADGLAQFHLSGGEPMARMKDLAELIFTADKTSEFYVLTSGFNFTAANARILKQAGLTGVVISLDHFDAEKHNAFRGFTNSFDQVKGAIVNAQQQHLVVALTLCVTRDFISWDNLLRYAEFAKSQKVVFIQLLEPKAVGHYQGKDVLLSESQLNLLERFYETMNFDPVYADYPIIIYHGYHQKRLGCLSGGNRGLYIDSEGFVNACPFCHTRNFNIKDVLAKEKGFPELVKASKCPSYENGSAPAARSGVHA